MIRIQIADQQKTLRLDRRRLRRAVGMVLADAEIREATISLAVVNDSTMHALNRRHLGHDYPTDVLSFLLEQSDSQLEGEIVVSSDTAHAAALDYGWDPAHELLLYVIHGALHLVGYDDHTAKQRSKMQAREREYLSRFGIERA